MQNPILKNLFENMNKVFGNTNLKGGKMIMDVTREEIEEKHKACIEAINEDKTCETCKHQEGSTKDPPCEDCYNTLLGFPVDPTKWEAR